MLKIEHLKKSYENFSLDCSLEVKKGHVTGLIGQNGAGKSTTFKAILGLISFDSGTINILGKSLQDFTAKDKTLIYNPDIYIELNEVIRNKIFKVHTFKISHLYFFIALFTSRLSLLLFKITSTTPMTRNYPSYLKYCDFLTDFHFL